MTGTPNSERLHIVLTGERNSGKSSLLNAIARQQVAIVSDVPGTTTDHVAKSMEIKGLGPCVLVDTAGLDDNGALGGKRIEATMDALRAADLVLAVVDASTGRIPELPLSGISVIPVINKCETLEQSKLDELCTKVGAKYGKAPVQTSALLRKGVQTLIDTIAENIPQDWNAPLLTAGLVEPGELAVLVMPQDSQAPKGRLILPQQQTIRELLDRKCHIVCCTPDTLASTLSSLKEAPAAIITDSQAFGTVKAMTPEKTRLTSFSILLAASKGDMDYFKKGAEAIGTLTPESRVLIAEACTHVPDSEDIGRVKIPALLRKRAGSTLRIDVVGGRDFPSDLGAYDLVIHCGACMFNRRYVLSRVAQAKAQGVPMTNYGIALAYLKNIEYFNNF